MNRGPRWLAVAGLAGACFLLGMRLSPQDSAAKAIATERYEAAKQAWDYFTSSGREFDLDAETRARWSRRLAEAAAESGALPARDAFAQHLGRMEKGTQTTQSLFDVGRGSSVEVDVMRFHLAEAKALAAQSAKK